MNPRHRARRRAKVRMAIVLAWVAGGTDGVGYLVLAHLFTAHMSGNSVAFGVALGQRHWLPVVERGITIAVFSLGIAISTVVGDIAARRGFRHSATPVFVAEILMLVVFFAAGEVAMHGGGVPRPDDWRFYALAALPTIAMGLQSATLRRISGRSVGTTYVSGMLTNFVESVVHAAFRRGGPRSVPYGAVLAAYGVGAVLAGAAYSFAGFDALALPILGMFIIVGQELVHREDLATPGSDG